MMRTVETNLFLLMQRHVGTVLEREGDKDHPLIRWWLSLCGFGLDAHDEIAWCSAAINGVAYELRLPRSKSAAARSWLRVGEPVTLEHTEIGFDVVVMSRGAGKQPGPEVVNAPGHVGLFAGLDGRDRVWVLGGNQGDTVSIESFPMNRILGIRRLA